ncbi:MAG: acyl-CoA dehydrogenase family protein, partial [Gammaproteobacteria bacterium]|nr:acyl-CoA dehydrogenase family protein [Gammaproteobacteria bacterium]
MRDTSYLDWPFLEPRHRELEAAIDTWAGTSLDCIRHDAIDDSCRELVRRLGAAGWLEHAVPPLEAGARHDVRALCLIRETLARHDGLADFAFAMQGLGMGPVTLFGDAAQREWLEKTRSGQA